MKIDEFKTEIWLDTYENDCRYNLSETCVSPMDLSELQAVLGPSEDMMQNIMKIRLGYGDITGSTRLRSAISGLYNDISPSQVTITHGGIGANSLLMLACIDPGDRVITASPSYQQNSSLTDSIGAEVTTIELLEEDDWRLDIQKLRDAVTADTKMICLTNPNNPTGTVFTDDELAEIVETARSADARLVIDEAYRGLTYEDPHFCSAACDVYEKGISTGSLSKTFSTAGIRVGWIAGPSEIIERIDHIRDYHIISVGGIDDYIASVIIENKDRIIERNIDICRKNLSLVTDFVNAEKHISLIPPQAGTTAFPRFDLDMTSREFCLRMLREESVLLVPGSAFDCEGHFRLGFGEPEDVIRGGLEHMSEWLRQF